MTDQPTYQISDAQLRAAADWYARMSDEAANEADWLAFTDWLEADDGHRLAYDQIETLAHSVSHVDAPSALTDAPHDAAMPEEPASATVIDARSRFLRPRAWAAAALAAAVLWMAVVNLGTLQSPDPVITDVYETGPQETRQVTLADGSSVHLNINTRLEVRFEQNWRHTSLAQGEALFDIAHNNDRPFLVGLGDQQVRVVGTVFNILRHEGIVTVTVQEGIVDVAPPANQHGAASAPSRLTKGLQLTHTEGTADTRVATVDADAVVAWQSGFLEYEDAPLEQVVADLRRYSALPIRLEGDVGALLFSGILNTRDLGSAYDLLEGVLPLRIERAQQAVVITVRAGES